MRLILFILILTPITIFSQQTKSVGKSDLFGKWQFTYIEAFDWSSMGLGKDSLDMEYFIVFEEDKVSEIIEPKKSSIVRVGRWQLNNESNKVEIVIENQESGDGEADSEITGMRIELEILKIDSETMELNCVYPDNFKLEFALNGLGLCKLTRID